MNEPDDWTTHVTAGPAWRRFGLMVIYLPILACVGCFIAFTALFQFFNVLAQGEPDPHLSRNGRDLGRYACDIIDFLTYNNEKRPFPFAAERRADTQSGLKPKTAKSDSTAPRKKAATRKKPATRKKSTTRRTTSRKKSTTVHTHTTRTESAPEQSEPETGQPTE